MTSSTTRICILGGGFGGLFTALRLSELPWTQANQPEIILIDQREHFLFSPLLYELLTGELQTWEIAPPYVELLAGTGVRFQQGTIAGIDLPNRRVQLQAGAELTYDRLVLALGGETPLDRVPGSAEHAIAFRTLSDAYRLQEHLRALENSALDRIRIAVVGAGYSGVELACKLADRLNDRGRIRLIEQGDRILRNSPEFNRVAAQKALEARDIWLDLETTVDRVEADTISLCYKGQVDSIPVNLVLWTIGNRMHTVIKDLPLKQNQRGQVLVNPTLQVMDRPEVFALGDLVDCRDADDQQVPASAQAALQEAEYVGWNIWASLTERPLLPFRYQFLGEMMTLGIDNATLTGLGITLDGPLASVARRLAYLYRMPTLQHQIRVGLNWMAKPLMEIFSIR
ncbi:FAD-dependent oxidoreductase [Leptolyngbya sp. 'hensonii']|uniref:NAD(P)/FAD-dependent oxidoreductase n=1 Tax=Leptolyngbya sp. 'hensonii' TaxID=1922337 RepID=UPI00094F9C86|nr:NAD(P)/FAD-dependent oxidoreductase [Leptolyngbya sp. 'hensonii']OLP15494.1 FAD-dependent oxidoreductase [Leptolyngbya sp. 'hensonii']